MNKKSLFIIIATLLLGFVLGMLTSASIRYQKLKPVRFFFSEERFREGIYQIINPDEEQKEKLEVVIKKYARSSRELQSGFRKQFEDLTRNLWNEMEPLMTEEQGDKIQEMEKRRQDFSTQGKGRIPNDSSRMRHSDDSFRMRHMPDSGRWRGSQPAPGR